LLGYPATTGAGADNYRVKELFAGRHRRMRMVSLSVKRQQCDPVRSPR
jgi:hypothetical protein